MRNLPRKFTGICLAVLLVGCVSLQRSKVDYLAVALPKLTAAIQAEMSWGIATNQMSDSELLAAATKDLPQLQSTFRNTVILIRHDTNDVVVLICSPDKKHKWLEDASWTTRVDVRWYLSNQVQDVDFSIPLRQQSAQPTAQ